MTEKPGWAASCGYDIFERMVVFELGQFLDKAFHEKTYNISRDSEFLLYSITSWFIESGMPINKSSLADYIHWSRGKVERNLKSLIDQRAVTLDGNEIYPSTFFLRGSTTSGLFLEEVLRAADQIKKLIRERKENTPDYKERAEILDERIRRVRAIEDI